MTPDQPPSKAGPVKITEWRDEKSDAVGWLVVDRHINGLAGGGVFMWSGASLDETVAVSKTMTKKFAICPSPIGGAKAGIRCDLKDPDERDAVCGRFLRAMRAELECSWVTAGDFGTSDLSIQTKVRELTGRDMQWPLYKHAAPNDLRAQELSRRAADLYRMDLSAALLPPGTPRPDFTVPLIEAAVGAGIVKSIMAVFLKLDSRRKIFGQPLEGVRIALQGAGTVGTGVMLYAARLGAEVVAISDAEGIVYDPDGLDIEVLLTLRARAIARMSGERQLAATKLLTRYAAQAQSQLPGLKIARREPTRAASGVDSRLTELLLECPPVNVFVPAASRCLWTVEALHLALSRPWNHSHPRLMVSGANNPFGVAGGDGLAKPGTPSEIEFMMQALQASGVICVPDFRANGGTAQLFHCYASGELDWILERTGEGVPSLGASDQEKVLDCVTDRIWRAVNEDLELCAPSLVDLPSRAERRVEAQLEEVEYGISSRSSRSQHASGQC